MRLRLNHFIVSLAVSIVAAVSLSLGACGVFLPTDDDTEVGDAEPPSDSFLALEAISTAEGSVIQADGATVPCPTECNGGCDNGECVIVCLEDAVSLEAGVPICISPIQCPADIPCHVKCLGQGGPCSQKTIACEKATRCTVDCLGDNACSSGTIQCGQGPCSVTCGASANACAKTRFEAENAPSLCMRCLNFPEACNNVDCALGTAPACSRVCDPPGACADEKSSCGECMTVATCR